MPAEGVQGPRRGPVSPPGMRRGGRYAAPPCAPLRRAFRGPLCRVFCSPSRSYSGPQRRAAARAAPGGQARELPRSACPLGVRRLALGSEPGGDQAAAVSAAVERLLEALSRGTPRSFIVVPSEVPRSLQMPAAGLAAESGAAILLLSPRGLAATSAVLARAHHPSLYVVGASSLAAGARPAL